MRRHGDCARGEARKPDVFWSSSHTLSNVPLQIMGHSGLVLALEWHLTEPFLLATGARDRTVKVWYVRSHTFDRGPARRVISSHPGPRW